MAQDMSRQERKSRRDRAKKGKKLHTICIEPELQGRDAQVAVSPRSGHSCPQTKTRDGKLELVCWIMACKFKIEVGGLPQTHLDTSQHG